MDFKPLGKRRNPLASRVWKGEFGFVEVKKYGIGNVAFYYYIYM